MAKLILLSVLFMTVTLPILAARERHPARAVRRVILYAVLFNLAYAFGVLVIIPRIGLV